MNLHSSALVDREKPGSGGEGEGTEQILHFCRVVDELTHVVYRGGDGGW